jgi:hypothetical protein
MIRWLGKNFYFLFLFGLIVLFFLFIGIRFLS